MQKGIARHGAPQRFLTDNHTALNPTRRGYDGQLVRYLRALGVQAITGKPATPRTQGKNERFHQTLIQYLNARPLPGSIADLQVLVDAFDEYYNTQRRHQGLPGRITPQQAWDATPVADPPRPAPTAHDLPTPPRQREGNATLTASPRGLVRVLGTEFMIGLGYAGTPIHVIWDLSAVEFFDHTGEHILTHPHPPKGTRYVGNGRPRGFLANPEPSTKS